MRPLLLLLGVQSVVMACLLIVGLDLYAHRRTDGVAGLNIWGYRGPVTHQKQARELRVVLLGGSRAFGWGQDAFGTMATVLRRLIMLETDRPGGELRPVSVINVARIAAPVASYRHAIEHYSYLQPDVICIYDDLRALATSTMGTSGVYTLTGYQPALPLALKEKGMRLRFGSVERGYQPDATPDERIGSGRRALGWIMQSAGSGLEMLDHRLHEAVVDEADAALPYDAALAEAIDVARQHARGVVVTLSPAETAEQQRNRRALLDRLSVASADRRLRIVDLDHVRELRDPELRLDGWNYGASALTLATVPVAVPVTDLLLER